MKWILTVAALLLVTPAIADEVKLQSGATIKGIVKENPKEPNRVEIEVGVGTVWVDRADILSMEKGRTALHEYYEKWEAVKDSAKAQDYLDLAAWCRENKVPKFIAALMQAVLKLDANNEVARKELGFHKYEGKWMTRDEMNRAKGLVEFDGRWMTAAEKELLVKSRLEAREKAELAKADRKRREDEERERRIERAMEQWDITHSPYGYYYRPSEFWPAYYHGPARRGPRYYGGGFYDAQPTFDVFGYLSGTGFFGSNIKKK